MIKKILRIIKSDLKYLYLKNLPKHKYKIYLEKQYNRITGETLNIDNPQKYTEKIQYAKLNLNSSIKTKLSDKYLVRDWIKTKIGSEYLIPLLGVWDKISDVEFSDLPTSFVLKLNSGSGANMIVKNKDDLNYTKTKLIFKKWLKKNPAFNGDIQPHYEDIQPKIIAEKYIQDSNGEINDYKFLCFDGKVYYCWIDVGRHSKHYRNIYNLEWELQPWQQHTYEHTPYEVQKPKNFEKMIEIAEILCEGFSHVRVDLYNLDGKIYFGEMTFTNGGGFEKIYPEKYNYYLGNLWHLY